MLKALYDYGIRFCKSTPPGFAEKAIRAYIDLSSGGDFLGIELCGDDKQTQICPDIGALANSPDKCNPLAEKAEIILAVPTDEVKSGAEDGKEAQEAKKRSNNIVKRNCFRSMLESGAEYSETPALCLKALDTPEIFAAICDEAARLRLKPQDRVTFKVDGDPITEGEWVSEWWGKTRVQYSKKDTDGEESLCLITGEPVSPLATLPKVSGLQTVGGHTSGEALFCFDKSSFTSYGLRQSANAPVSEEAFTVVRNALNDLLSDSPSLYRRDKNSKFNPVAPVFSGMKFVHWYDKSIEPEDDDIFLMIDGGSDDAAEAESAEDEADRLIEGITSGEAPTSLPAEYHILLISGAGGRAMIRRYEHGSYEVLQENLRRWNSGLELCDSLGTGTLRPVKLSARLIRLMPHSKSSDGNVFEKMKKELAGITPYVIMSIINGTMLPDSVAVRALAYIRAEMIKSDEDDAKAPAGNKKYRRIPDGIACQWLKVWLTGKRRMQNEEVQLMPTYNSEFPNAAYHCGAIMAVYAEIQREAMPNVNAGIAQRYYSSASRTPALVLGVLERMSKHHIDKIRDKEVAGRCEKHLNEAYSYFGDDAATRIPTVLTPEGQSYFAIGYRQMCARLTAEDIEKKAAKANKNTDDEKESE